MTKILVMMLNILLLTAAGLCQTTWELSDTQIEVIKDTSHTPAKWVGGDSGVAVQKRWNDPNAGKSFSIKAVFGWTGIPLLLGSDAAYSLSVSLEQQANNETGYDSWIKIYAGEKGGAEVDGPSASASWREPICRQEATATLPAPPPSGTAYVIRVLCKVAGDSYVVRYTYLPVSASGPNRESLSGAWRGTWSNSLGESGVDTLSLQEDGSGNLSGIWSGIPVRGRRLSPTEIELRGSDTKRAYTARGKVEGAELVLRYTAERLDSSGPPYTGESRFGISR